MSIDDKIVSVTFDARKFESGVNKTISNVNKLNSSLKFPNAGKGFDDVNKAAQRVDLSHISSGVDSISSKLGALRLTAVAVFSSIAIQAVSAGARLAKSITVQPLVAGFQEYATNLNAIQTILANTQASGATLKDVNAALLDLNRYSDKTIYNFSQMAKNIGTFTAAGVDLKTATGAIKGIANLAALSGSNADQASTAMYQLSQAISSGRVSLQDWNSVVNAGMGGTVFQRALATTAVSMGKLKDSSLKLVGPMKNVSIQGKSFRQSIQSGPGKQSWLTSDVLTKTLQQFTGDLTDAQLKAQGFNDAQIKSIQQTAKTALHAATEVKTLTQVFDVAKETAGSGWAQTFQLIFGNFGEAKKTFTALSNAINGFINTNARARNKVLADWKALGGRAILIDNIKQLFQNLGSILKPIKNAFRDIFPAKTGKDLLAFTVTFAKFAQQLKPSPTTMKNLRRTFRGFFAVLDIGKQIISGVVTVFKELFHATGTGNGSFLKFTANIGDFLVSLDKALKKGDAFHNFFVKMGVVLAAPIKLLSFLAHAIGHLFSGFSPGGVSAGINGVTKAMTPLQKAIHGITVLWDTFIKSIKGTAKFLIPDVDKIAEAFQQLGPAITNAVSHMNFDAILQTIRTGLFAALVIMFRNFLGKGGGLFRLQSKVTIFSLMFKNLGSGIGALTGTLNAMQNNIRSKTLLNIAIAVALLAASVVALSLADPKRVNAALASMTLMFVELIGALKVMEKTSTTAGAVKIAILSGSLILLAGAIDLLTLSVLALSRLSWDQLKKGLGGLTVLLVEITTVSQKLGESAPGMIRAGIGISAIAVGLNIMALAIRQLGTMKASEIAKGLTAIGVSLGLIVGTMMKIPTKSLLRVSISINAIAVALNILALAVLQFGRMNLKTMAQGLAGIGASLVIISKAMALMPEKNLLRIGASLLLISIALQGIAYAVGKMGQMSTKEIAHGLIALAGALLLMGDALHAMDSNIRGAAALGVMATGLALLVPSLILLGKQSWKTIIKGLTGLAATMAIMVLASKFLDTVSLSLLGFGAALFLIGGAIALAGAGIALFGVGLSAVAVSGSAAVAVLIQAIDDFIAAVPEMAKNFVLGLLAIVRAFSETAPLFVDAMIKIVESLLDVIIRATPKLVKVMEVVISAILKVIHDKAPDVIKVGLELILSLLKGLSQNIKAIVVAAGEVIINFLKGLGTKATDIVRAGFDIIVAIVKGIANGLIRLVDAGAKAIVKFLNALADAITKYEPQILKAGARIGAAILEGIGISLKDGTKALIGKIKDLADKMIHRLHLSWLIHSPSLVAEGIGQNITQGLADGITKNQHIPVKATEDMSRNMTTGLANGIKRAQYVPIEATKYMSKNMIIAAKGTFGISSTGTSLVMEQLGKDITTSFAQGLRGSPADIKQAFIDLDSQLFDAASSARDNIKTEDDNIRQEQDNLKQELKTINDAQKKLNQLNKDPKKNKQTIAETTKSIAEANKAMGESNKSIINSQKIIHQNQAVIDAATTGHIELTKTLQNEKAELVDLVKGYDSISAKMEKANQALADAKQIRKDAFKEFKDEFDQIPDITATNANKDPDKQVAAYEKALQDQIDAIKAFHKTLNKLRELGLDDTTYKKLLADGTVDQQFADALLAGGKSAVRDVNKLDSQLKDQSISLAKDASASLYDAGVAAAQGLADGLRNKRSELASSIEFLAKSMVGDIKKALGIKSPSTVFAEIGTYATQGIAKGLIDSSKTVTDAIYMVSDDAMGAMNDSLSKISSMVADNIDSNPTITPILDLSQVQEGAKSLGSILKAGPIGAGISTRQASLIASRTGQPTSDSSDMIPSGDSIVKFEQNNYSPESLSEIDIYRNTKNLFAQHSRRIKGV